MLMSMRCRFASRAATTLIPTLLLALVAILPSPSLAQGETASATPETLMVHKHFGRAAAEVVGINALVWAYDRYIRPFPEDEKQGEGFRISFNSWWENIKNGFEWDDNNFSTNQFAHPYHGSLYFNAARANGYDFWESMPFSFMGSIIWEYFGETHNPSINDWVATSVGGIAVGEALWRFSSVILDNEKSGSGRGWREVGALAVNPMRGVNRIFTGEFKKVHANPPDRLPNFFGSEIEVGLRTVGQDRIWDADTTRVYINFDFRYGDPFRGDINKPFDSFDFGLQINFADESVIGRGQAKGLLAGTTISESENSQHILAAYHHYDYVNNRAYQFGGQSIGASLLSRFPSRRENGLELRTRLHLNGMILGATKSDYLSLSGREYDYGPGLGFKFDAGLSRRNVSLFYVSHEQYYIKTINGTDSDHNLSITRARLTVPIWGMYGIGLDYQLYLRESLYTEFADVSQRSPEFRVFLFSQPAGS
jgi:hypothetical protein